MKKFKSCFRESNKQMFKEVEESRRVLKLLEWRNKIWR